MSNRLVVIGLDCVTPQLLYGDWLEEMPHIRRLMSGGYSGNLISTIPPITVPAWMSMMTSHDPGMLGCYGFRNRKSYEYEDLYITNSNHIEAKTVWNHLSRHRLRSILLGVPLTYPPKPLNGILVSSFLAPGKDVDFTYPPEYKATLEEVVGGDYIIDVKNFRTTHKERLRDQIYAMTERRFKAYRHMLTTEDWDFAMMVEMGPDRIHHGFWRYGDSEHRLYEQGNPYQDVIHDYYLYLDQEIGRTLETLPDDVSVIVVSDHGAKGMKGGICINEFLIKNDFLKLKSYPKEPTRLRPHMIDWPKTKVWGEGGYYARMFMNVEDREPQGTIPSREYDSFRRDLKQMIQSIPDSHGEPIGTKVFLPEEVYRKCKNIPPDLIVYLGDLDWRSAGTVGHRKIHIFENDTGPDDANHAQEGIFIWHNHPKLGTGGDNKVSIYDVAPSILDFYSIPIPDEMVGTPLHHA
ncbi:MAG: alkaline phosphatase family protein [Candidatus Krumholzibacteria bacterium]|nr:alkaline phosphatase family protein [Candidatus Krumholzibacteria bacterium]